MLEHKERRSAAPWTFAGAALAAVVLTLSQTAAAEAFQAEPEGTILRSRVEDFHVVDAQIEGMIARALENHPRLAAARARYASRREGATVAGSLPDPRATYRYFARTPETRVGPQRQGIELTQMIPWAGRRGLREEGGRHDAEVMGWRARELERDLVADLKRAYFEAAYLQEAVATNAGEMVLLERFEQIALTRYTTGEGSQQDVIKVQTEISRLEDRDILLGRMLREQERRIARLVGDPAEAIALESIDLEPRDVSADRETLERVAMEEHPSVRAALERIEADRTMIERSVLEGRPDFMVGVGYIEVDGRDDAVGMANPPEDNGQDVLSVMVGIDIPIWRGRVRAGLAEADERLRESESSLRDTRDGLRLASQETVLRLESLSDRIRLYREVLIPQAEESLGSAEASYTTNRQGILELLDAERVLFEVRLLSYRLVSDLWMEMAELERLLGRRYPDEDPPRNAISEVRP